MGKERETLRRFVVLGIPAVVFSLRPSRAVRSVSWPAKPASPQTLVVIGAHRAELAFGERVAALLDPSRFSVLRIAEGISGRRPRQDEVESHRRRHRELYLQILTHVAPRQHLLIDLHTGIDESRRSADVLCADRSLLDCVAARLESREGADRAAVRCIGLIGDTAPPDAGQAKPESWAVARPELPEKVWNRGDPRYVGLEVYLSREGPGTESDWAFAHGLLETIASCAL
jgi:hypothetical protein